jgi:hypothetical protein
MLFHLQCAIMEKKLGIICRVKLFDNYQNSICLPKLMNRTKAIREFYICRAVGGSADLHKSPKEVQRSMALSNTRLHIGNPTL